ncbi:unnamed protein product, partial [Meganyctiphanes norvegica]
MHIDQDQRIKTLRRELEGWREILVCGHDVLIWKQQYYPAVSVGAVTFFFILVWGANQGGTQLFSVIAVTVCPVDFAPINVVPWVIGQGNWTGAQERRYEEIIKSLAGVTHSFSAASTTLASMKNSKPKTYFGGVSGSLLCMAWIGSTINNLLLTYLIALLVVLYPGLKHHGILKKYFSSAIASIAALIKSSVGSSNTQTSGTDTDNHQDIKKE